MVSKERKNKDRRRLSRAALSAVINASSQGDTNRDFYVISDSHEVKRLQTRSKYKADPAPYLASNNRYYASNSSAIQAKRKQVYELNPAHLLAKKKRIYAANPALVLANKKRIYAANPAPVLANKKRIYAENPAPVLANKKRMYAANPAPVLASKKRTYAENPVPILANKKRMYVANSAHLLANKKRLYAANPDIHLRRLRHKYATNAEYAAGKKLAFYIYYRLNQDAFNTRRRTAKVSTAIRRKYNLFANRRDGLKLKGSTEMHITKLALMLKQRNAVDRRMEAERIMKWCLYIRSRHVKKLKKVFSTLKEKATVSLTRSGETAESSIADRMTALCGNSLHTTSSEPYFYESTYKVFVNNSKKIEMNRQGQAMNIFNTAPNRSKPDNLSKISWTCSEDICNVKDARIAKRMGKFMRLVSMCTTKNVSTFVVDMATCKKPPTFQRLDKLGHSIDCHSCVDYCESNLLFLRTVAPHFPEIRNIVKTLYSLRNCNKQLRTLDVAIKRHDVDALSAIAVEVESNANAFLHESCQNELNEAAIMATFKNAFKAFTKSSMDTPKYDCISCEKLCFKRNVTEINKMRQLIVSEHWIRLLKFNENRHVKGSAFICNFCLGKFKLNLVPATCILNGLVVDERPQEIVVLNDYEKILIQRAKAFQVVTRMGTVGRKNLPHRQMVQKVVGRTFHLPLPLEETLKKLPLAEDPLNKNQEVYIMVRGVPTKSKIVWESKVDTTKVLAVLTKLKLINPLYAQIHLPERPEQLLDAFNNDGNEIEFDCQPQESISDAEIEENIQLTTTQEAAINGQERRALLTQVDPTNAESAYEQFTIQPLHEARDNNSATALYQMLKVNEAPIDSRDKLLDVKCFPDLYPCGQFGQFHERDITLKSADFIKTKLMSKHPEFRNNQQYLFYLLNDANMRQLSAGIYQKLNIVNPKERLSAASCLDKMTKEELEGSLTTIFSRLRNSEQFWNGPRNDINCMSANYGPATWFLTISPSEWDWEDLGQYIRDVNDPDKSNKSTSELVALDPVSASRFIDNKFHAMLEFIKSDDGPLGNVSHFFWRREYQSRGLQHFHLLLWVEDAPVLGENPVEEVAAFINKYVTCKIPDEKLCPVLYKRVMNFQKHVHNSYCLRNKKLKKGKTNTTKKVCRFGFPRPMTDALVMRDITVSIAGRKALKSNSRLYDLPRTRQAENINDYNPAVLLAWNGNMDLQFVGEKTATLNWYITKYTTKCEKSHGSETFEMINSTKSLCSRLYNFGMRALNNRECGALEASDTLLGIPLHGTDINTTIKWLDVNMTRNRRLKSRDEVKALPSDSTDIFFPSVVDNHYPERPDELEDMHLLNFVKSFDIVKVKPKSDKFVVYNLENGTFLKERSRPYLVNHFKFNVNQNPEKYFYSLMLMFKPWRDTDELKEGYNTYAEAFHACKDGLLGAIKYDKDLIAVQTAIEKVNALVGDKVKEFEQGSPANDDDAPDNPLAFAPVEVVGAMQEFREAAIVDEFTKDDVDAMIKTLNVDQKRMFDNDMKLISDPNGAVLRKYVSGTAGTGKSHYIKILKSWVKVYLGKDVAVSAPTGISAWNVNGLTLHRLLQLPVEHGHTPKYTELSDQVLKVLRDELKNVVLFIIDEISMVSNLTFMFIHLRLSEIFATKDMNDGWFGKKHILLFGDLLQLPPVHEESPFIKLSTHHVDKYIGALSVINLWRKLFSYDELTINMRQLNDSTFVDMLKRIRVGSLSRSDCELLEERKIPFTSVTLDGRLAELAHFISKLPVDAVCLLPTRHLCSVLNTAILSTIESEEISLIAEDTLDCAQYLKLKVNKLVSKYDDDSSRTAGLEKTITIKLGSKVMLKRNIDVTIGLVNGAIGNVVSIKRNAVNNDIVDTIKIQFSFGLEHELEKISSKFEVMDRAFVFRKQFPITTSYGITIHKSQGLSLKTAAIDIGTSVFSCGQAYVALSRVTKLEGIHLINFNPLEIKAQKSAILEYNRLRSLYRKDLGSMTTNDNVGISKICDRTWAVSARADQVQTDANVEEKNTKKVPRTLPKIFTPKGFHNLDSVSCYANATLQCLLHNESLRSQLAFGDNHDALQSLAIQYSDGSSTMSSSEVRSLVGGMFLVAEQQDASEFLTALVSVSDAIKTATEYTQKYSTHCNSCNYNSLSAEETGNVFRLFVPSNRNINSDVQTMFNALSDWEAVNDFRCGNCQSIGGRRRRQLSSTSDLIVLQLVLFHGVTRKITDFKLSGVPSATLLVNGINYKPVSAVFHHGNSMEMGHYMSYLRHGTRWHCANDTQVTIGKWPHQAKNMYLLICKKS